MDTQPAYWTIGPALGSASSVGRRGYVESASCLCDYSERASKGFLCFMAVADGFGGPGLGDVAARMAVEIVSSALDPGQYESEDSFRPVAERLIAESVGTANKRLYDVSGMEGKEGMGTTLTCAALDSENAFVGHIGNARAYVLTARGLRQVTGDHVETSASGAKRLTRALGVAPEVDADLLRVPLRPGEVFFICTHGMFSTFSAEEMSGALLSIPDLQAACQWLTDAAVARGASGEAAITAWRVPGDVPVVMTQPQAQEAEAEPKKKHGRRWLVALAAIVVLLAGAAGGWFLGSVWYQDKGPAKKPSTASTARFAAGDIAVVDTTGRPQACYLVDYPGGPEQTRLYDGWKVRIISPKKYKGDQWYRVEVTEGGLGTQGKTGYVAETFLVESR
jgi:PPM family protein phosphatase